MTRHTDKEIAQATRRFERLADSLDPTPNRRQARVEVLLRALVDGD
jgi:hypothetical protein